MDRAKRNADIKQRYESGDTLKALSGAYNLTQERVKQILDAQGVQRRPSRKLPLEVQAALAERYRAGETTPMLAKAFAISPTTVQHTLQSQGVVMRPPGSRFHAGADAHGKVCTGCHVKKSYTEFILTADMNDGRSSRCKACYRENRKAHYRRNIALELW